MKQKEQRPRYGMRKLSVGFVSCLLGFTLIAGFLPGSSYAASGSGTNRAMDANQKPALVGNQSISRLEREQAKE